VVAVRVAGSGKNRKFTTPGAPANRAGQSPAVNPGGVATSSPRSRWVRTVAGQGGHDLLEPGQERRRVDPRSRRLADQRAVGIDLDVDRDLLHHREGRARR
jgi:hypothetical protein